MHRRTCSTKKNAIKIQIDAAEVNILALNPLYSPGLTLDPPKSKMQFSSFTILSKDTP